MMNICAHLRRSLLALGLLLSLSGCAVVTVAGAVVGVAATAASVAADVAVGTVKAGAAVAGAAVDVVVGDDDEDEE